MRNCISILLLILASVHYISAQGVPPLPYKDLPKKVRVNFETMYPQKNTGGFKSSLYISSSWQKINDSVYEVRIVQSNKSIRFSRYYKNGVWQMTGEFLTVAMNKVTGLPKDLENVLKTQYKSATILSAAKISTPFYSVLYEIYYIQNNKKVRRYFVDSGFAIDKLE